MLFKGQLYKCICLHAVNKMLAYFLILLHFLDSSSCFFLLNFFYIRGTKFYQYIILQWCHDQYETEKKFCQKFCTLRRYSSTSNNDNYIISIVVVESLSCVQLFASSWTAACHASLPLNTSSISSNCHKIKSNSLYMTNIWKLQYSSYREIN